MSYVCLARKFHHLYRTTAFNVRNHRNLDLPMTLPSKVIMTDATLSNEHLAPTLTGPETDSLFYIYPLYPRMIV
jgi:hypothetical protein